MITTNEEVSNATKGLKSLSTTHDYMLWVMVSDLRRGAKIKNKAHKKLRQGKGQGRSAKVTGRANSGAKRGKK